MKLFLDQGLPRSTVSHLLKHGIPSVHAGDAGLANASDASILERSRKEGWIVATLDADFHALLALSAPPSLRSFASASKDSERN
jgi:predicted nuclease of predicted toxin-antitoxin system